MNENDRENKKLPLKNKGCVYDYVFDLTENVYKCIKT